MQPKYSAIVQWSEEDEAYIAIVPELEGLSAFGDSPEEALKELSVAKELFIKVMEEDGEILPDPEYMAEYSGQIRIRLPKSLHKSLSIQAKQEGVSLNTLMVQMLSARSSVSNIEKKLLHIKEDIYLLNKNILISNLWPESSSVSHVSIVTNFSNENESEYAH